MAKGPLAWVDGKWVSLGKANIPVLSHALHYGGGVFEGIRAYETPNGTAVFRMHDHVDRLFNSAAALDIKIPFSKKQIEKAILEIVKKNHFKECYIRPIVFYGHGRMQLDPIGAKIRVVIAAWPWGRYLGDHKTLSVKISRYTRFDPRSIAPGAKITGFYATSVLARIEARKNNFDECALLDHEGFVAEGPGENIFIVKKGKLIVPKSPAILNGITRASVIAIAKDLKIPIVQKRVSQKELMTADEAFFSGTAVEIGIIGRINQKRIGRRGLYPIGAKIKSTYSDVTHGKLPRYRGWLSY